MLGGSLRGVSVGSDYQRPQVQDILALEDVLTTRAAAFAIAGVGSFELSTRLTALYVRALKGISKRHFRKPSLGEVRWVDMLLFEDIRKHDASGDGNIDDGL